MNKKVLALAFAGVAIGTALTGCSTDADTTSYNLSQEAEQFKIVRHITAINDFTDEVVMDVEGFCSMESADSALEGSIELTCKVGPDEYFKNYLILGDNGIVSVEQIENSDVDEYHYKWIVKPEVLIPDIEVKTGASDSED